MPSRVHPWHLWPGRHWPATAREEDTFITALEAMSSARARKRAVPDRAEVTAVLNALRCGISAEALVELLPGCGPAKLASAYRQLDVARARSEAAWLEICKNPTEDCLAENVAASAMIAAVPVARVAAAARTVGTKAAIGAVERVQQAIGLISDEVDKIENQLGSLGLDPVAGIELGRVLYDPYTPGMWGHEMYVPRRVGDLTPVRVRDLLGER